MDRAVMEATRVRLVARFGALVEPWWDGLPGALDELAARWELELGEPVGRGNTSLVLRCRRADGRAAILKLTPDAELGAAEAQALRAWEPSGRVPLTWGHDAASGVLLLEAIASETPLADSRADVALDDVAGLIGALHRCGPPPDGVATLAERVEFIFGHWAGRSAAVPDAALARGHELARALAGGGRPVLLHGDLHPGNVLDGGAARGLVAIDPRPCVGDGAFDALDWVFYAPEGWEARSRELAAALELDAERLWGWCRAFAPILATSAALRGRPVDALMRLAP